MSSHRPVPHPCLGHPATPPHRTPTTPHVILIIVITTLATILTLLKTPQDQVTHLLLTTGMVAIALSKTMQATPTRTIRAALRTLASRA